mmetsp:Transcript_108487/g.203660  ORF Transcript_108487/g.203660 Transcript_108487/m.203660 type:complete len:586 (-) Transcript_108487:128-1885(-)
MTSAHLKQEPKAQKPKNVLVINKQIIEAAQKHDLQQLLWTISKHLLDMNLVNLSTALHRVAKLANNSSATHVILGQCSVVHQLLEAIVVQLQKESVLHVKPQSLSNILWALASLQIVSKPIIQLCLHISEQSLASFKPFEVSTTLWALAKLKTLGPGTFPSIKSMFDAAALHLAKHVKQFEFRCLSMIAWSYATSQEFNAQFFCFLGTYLAQKVAVGCGQELSLTAWAFGTAGIRHQELFDALTGKALHQMDVFKPQELSNLVWGCASCNYFHQELFAAVLSSAKQKKLGSQHLANILWAFSRASPDLTIIRNAHFVLLPQCMEHLDVFKPEEISSVALSTAKAFGRDSAVDSMKKPNRARPTWNLQTCPAPPLVLKFFKRLVRCALARSGALPGQVLVNILETYSRVCRLPVDAEDCALFLDLAHAVVLRMSSLSPDWLLRICRLFTVGELSGIPGKAVVIQPLVACVAQSFGYLGKEHEGFGFDVFSEAGSAQPTDEPASSEDKESCVSWDSEEVGSDLLSPKSSSSSAWNGGHNSSLLASVKNTFLHFHVDDPDEQHGGGGARRRASSAPGRCDCSLSSRLC